MIPVNCLNCSNYFSKICLIGKLKLIGLAILSFNPIHAPNCWIGFAKAIDSRGQAGEKLDFQFVGFEKVDFVSVSLAGKRASVVVKFASQMISATHDKAGALIDGNPREVRDITDIWTFERDVAQKDPNWRVVATETQA